MHEIVLVVQGCKLNRCGFSHQEVEIQALPFEIKVIGTFTLRRDIPDA